MIIKRFLSLIIALAIGQGAALAIDVDDPPEGVFSDEWYVVYLKGQKSGHSHITMERVAQAGEDTIRSRTYMIIEMARAEQGVKVAVTQQTEESIKGDPLSFEHNMKLGAMAGPSSKGAIADGKVTVTTSQFGQESPPQVYDLPENAMMPWAFYREMMKRGLEPGTKYDLPIYEPSIAPDRLTPTTMEILNRETIDLFGRKVEAVKTVQTMRLSGGIGAGMEMETTSWLTDEGEAVRMQMSIMNMPIEIVNCTRPIALAPNDPAELMIDTLIHVKDRLDPNAPRITYELSLNEKAGKAKLGQLPETMMQTIDKTDKNTIRFTVTRRSKEAEPGKAEPLTDKERARYLAASGMVNHKDEVVAALAKKAAGDEKDPNKLAGKLCRFVSDYIDGKNLNVGFATASEVARSKEGDCSEHGILLAALGRSVGIPTRIVTGIAYTRQFAGLQKVFVGHLWTQFWIDGQWVDLDAALQQEVPDATHIAMSISDAGDSGIADMVSSLWLNLGKLKLRVIPDETGDAKKEDQHGSSSKAAPP